MEFKQNDITHPLISIIVPVYNTKDYLEECIESIVNQSFNNFELILVNDGSTDGSDDICDDYANKFNNIKVIHKSNGGLSDARNFGINNSRGKYVLFIDSDDLIYENSLSYIYNVVLDNYGEIDLIFLESDKLYPNSNTKGMNEGFKRDLIHKKTKDKVMNHISNLNKYPGSACAKFVSRKLLIDNKIFFEKNLICEDIDWTIRLLLFAKTFDYCDKPYYLYRQNRENSITNSNYTNRFKSLLYIIEKYYNMCINNNLDYKKEVLSFISYEFSILIFLYSFLSKEDKREYKVKMDNYKNLLDYKLSKKNKLIKIFYNLFGLRVTSYFLKNYLYIRDNLFF